MYNKWSYLSALHTVNTQYLLTVSFLKVIKERTQTLEEILKQMNVG